MNTNDILTLLMLISTIIIGVIGFLITILQIMKASKIKRAEFIIQLVNLFRLDDKIVKATHLIDYDEKWYTSEFHNSEKEKCIDALFAEVNYILYLKKYKFLKKEEYKMFEYIIQKIINNKECQNYLNFLDFYTSKKKLICAFCYLLEYYKSKTKI